MTPHTLRHYVTPYPTMALLPATPEAEDIARYVTSFLKGGLESLPAEVTTVNTAAGTPVDWHTSFHEIVAPTIERGYQILKQKHGLELLGYAKILVDQFSKDTFLYLATSITTDDLEGLSWGRIVALFTVLCLVSTDLAEKQRCDTVELLQEWLAAFLSRDDLSEWVAKQGGWVSHGLMVSQLQALGGVMCESSCGRLASKVPSNSALSRDRELAVQAGGSQCLRDLLARCAL